MELDPTHTVINVPNAITVDVPHDEPRAPSSRPKMKRRGAMHIFKVALFMMRHRSEKARAIPADDGSKNMWKKLVGSVRPLHLQRNESPPRLLENESQAPLKPLTAPSPTSTDYSEDALFSPLASPVGGAGSSSPSSRYASAVGLNEMVQSEEEMEEECNHIHVAGEGDEMIDAKAEEYIANFYYQMRLQRLNSVDPHYREISERSLG